MALTKDIARQHDASVTGAVVKVVTIFLDLGKTPTMTVQLAAFKDDDAAAANVPLAGVRFDPLRVEGVDPNGDLVAQAEAAVIAEGAKPGADLGGVEVKP